MGKKLGIPQWVLLAIFFQLKVIFAQDVGEVLRDAGIQSSKGYLKPFPTLIGTGMNSGWYNTSKTLSFLDLPFGITIMKVNQPIVMLDKGLKTFDYSGEIPLRPLILNYLNQNSKNNSGEFILSNMENWAEQSSGKADLRFEETLNISVKDIPTIIGRETPPTYRLDSLLQGTQTLEILQEWNKNPAIGAGGADSISLGSDIALPFRGIVEYSGPAPSTTGIAAEASIGKIPFFNNITLGIRYFPPITYKNYGKFEQLGFKTQYEFTHFFPGIQLILPLHLSVMYAFNNFSLDINQYGSLDMNNNLYMLNASLDFKKFLGFGIYSGMGYEKSELKATIYDTKLPDNTILKGFTLKLPGENQMRALAGIRFSLLLFDIYADINTGSITSFNVGVAMGLNGL